MRFEKTYAALAVLLLATEIAIALYVHDQIVRPYVGDALVVILLYAIVVALFDLPKMRVLACVFAFACTLELAQHFQLVTVLGLQDNGFMRTVIGTTYSAEDLAAYAVGALATAAAEHLHSKLQTSPQRP